MPDPEAPKPGELPSVADVKADAERTSVDERREQRHFLRRFNPVAIAGERDYEHLRGLKAHYRHKSAWSIFLMAVMAFMLLFQSYLIYEVGTG